MMKRMVSFLMVLVLLAGLVPAAMAEAAREAALPDPLDFAYELYYTDATTDYGNSISHTYECDGASMQEMMEK